MHQGLCLLEEARERRARAQAFEIRHELLVPRERMNAVRVVERGRSGAVGEREVIPERPRPIRDLRVRDRVGHVELRARLVDAEGIALVFRPQAIGDDPLHRRMHVRVIEAVARATLERAIGIAGNEPGAPPLEILEYDGRLEDDAFAVDQPIG